MKVGVVGLGLMGSGMARRLASAGHELAVYNRSRQRAEPFSTIARIAASPKELAGWCDVVITVVTDFEAAKQVLLGPDGVAESKNRPIVADASTIAPAQSEYLAQELKKRGIEMLGMPVMGGPSAAEAGELTPMVAGGKGAFEKARAVIESLGKNVFYIGEKAGSANAVKLALNLNIALIATAVSEGITLARGSGIDPAVFVKILNSTYFKTGLSEKKGPKMVEGEFAPSFHLKNMLKDLELATATAQATGVAIPATSTVQQMFRAASNSGFSDQDYTAICAFLAKINGMAK
ncbi:NAD(P)-dependent oxidoreductase [Nitrososphaera sp.]|uniref:NAD(P)-dependent oxidoreductase n=1 Tax=Nitrososphaera sp. TaxID=1971748 RepID=UPI001842EFB8|nr:NAD(P)-dependent oxidoreductase [Nitrososphaera sp.]NWG37886.1 NAD(P)-dependent oxidoreductase [Nitrososphaera sp.]